MSSRLRVCYAIEPSFDSPARYRITVERDENGRAQGAIVSETSPHPDDTIGYFPVRTEKGLSAPDLKELRGLVEAVAIPGGREPVMVLDGTRFTLSIQDGREMHSFHWWEELPGKWSSLRPIIAFIHRVAPSQTSDGPAGSAD